MLGGSDLLGRLMVINLDVPSSASSEKKAFLVTPAQEGKDFWENFELVRELVSRRKGGLRIAANQSVRHTTKCPDHSIYRGENPQRTRHKRLNAAL